MRSENATSRKCERGDTFKRRKRVAVTSKGTLHSKLACQQQKPSDKVAAAERSLGTCLDLARVAHHRMTCAHAQLRGVAVKYARAQHRCVATIAVRCVRGHVCVRLMIVEASTLLQVPPPLSL